MAAVTIRSDFRAQKEEICHCFHLSPSICHKVMGLDAMILVFLNGVLRRLFPSPPLPSSRGSLVPLHLLSLEWYHLHIWGHCYFSWQSFFFFFKKILSLFLFFNWRIIALQNIVVFCQTSTWINHKYTYDLSLLNPFPISLPIPLL